MDQDQARKQVKEIFNQFGGMFSDQNDQSDYDELEEAVAALLRAAYGEIERLKEEVRFVNNALLPIADDSLKIKQQGKVLADRIEDLFSQLAAAREREQAQFVELLAIFDAASAAKV